MRHAPDWPGKHQAFDQVLPGGDVIYPVRYRSRLSLPLGGNLQGNAQTECRAYFRLDDFFPGHSVCRLYLRRKKRRVRLEGVEGGMGIKFGTSGWRGLIARDFTFENVRLATQAIAQFLLSPAAPQP